MPWLIARYQPVGLFSLKHGEATSTGGKSLLIPTPFAIRMALLDAALRISGKEAGKQVFDHIKAVQIALRPSSYAAVSGLFGKILKPERNRDADRAMTPTIAFREYVHLLDEIGLAFGGEQDDLQVIAAYLKHITYLGKRGSFIQMLDQPLWIEHLPTDFIPLQGPDLQNGELPSTFPLGLIQRVDEWGAELTFEKANVFDEEKIRPERDRQRMDVLIPYRLVRAGRGFTLYERSKG